MLTITGITILIVCWALLLLPLFGWRFKYDPSASPVIVDIPKAARYTFFIRRRYAFGDFRADNNVSFSIAIFDASDETQLISAHSMNAAIRSADINNIKVGEFNAPFAGKYLVVRLAESQFKDKDTIIIKKRVSRLKQILLTAGVTVSPLMIAATLASVLLPFVGLTVGALIIALNL